MQILSESDSKLLFRAALVAQAISVIVLLASDFDGQAASYASGALGVAGLLEITLVIRAKWRGESIID